LKNQKPEEYKRKQERLHVRVGQTSRYENEFQREESQNKVPKAKLDDESITRKPVPPVDGSYSQRPGIAKANERDQSPRKSQHNHRKRSYSKPRGGWLEDGDSGSPNRASPLAQTAPSELSLHSSLLPRVADTNEISWQQQSNRADLVVPIAPSESDTHSSLPPRVTDIGETSGQQQHLEPQGREALKSAEHGGNLNVVVDRIRRHLHNAKADFPSTCLEKDIPNPCSLADIEMAVSDLIQVCGSVHQAACQSFESTKDAMTKYKSLVTCLNKRIKQLNADISALEEEKESEISLLRTQHDSEIKKMQNDHWLRIQQLNTDMEQSKQGYEKQIVALEIRHRAELTAHKIAAQEAKRDYEVTLEGITEQNKQVIWEMEKHFNGRLGNTREKHLQEMDKKDDEIKVIKKECEADKKKMKELAELENKREQENKSSRDEIAALEIKPEQENKSLRDDIADLTALVAKRGHFRAMRDYDLANRFQKLANEVDGFARVRWDIKRESAWPFPDEVIRKSQNERITKKNIVLNTLWVILYEGIFCTPFRVLGEEGKSLEKKWMEKYGQG
jgi:hypothetical protein